MIVDMLSDILQVAIKYHAPDKIAKELHYAIMNRSLISDADKGLANDIWQALERHKFITSLEEVSRYEHR